MGWHSENPWYGRVSPRRGTSKMKTTTTNKKKLLKGIKAKASEITKRAKAAKEHLLNGNFKSKTLVVAPRNITSEEALEILKHRNFLYKNEQQVSTNRDLVARTVARIRMDIQEVFQ